ncbi:MAG: hypothetical protein ACW967_04735 [Candidatus Hodarchaeales archaeon]
MNEARNLLLIFDQLNIEENKQIKLRRDLANALILKKQSRVMFKVDAQRILAKIVNDKVIDHEMTIIAMLNLCDLLLDEWQTYNQEEVLKELMELLDKLYLVGYEYK